MNLMRRSSDIEEHFDALLYFSKHALQFGRFLKPSVDSVLISFGVQLVNDAKFVSFIPVTTAPFPPYDFLVDMLLEDPILLIISWGLFD